MPTNEVESITTDTNIEIRSMFEFLLSVYVSDVNAIAIDLFTIQQNEHCITKPPHERKQQNREEAEKVENASSIVE